MDFEISKCGCSNNSSTDISNLFQVMFNDLEIVLKYQRGAEKVCYSVNLGLGLVNILETFYWKMSKN